MRPNPAPSLRAVGYLRRSTDRQEQSLDDQRRAIEAYAATDGYDIARWYQDDAISGAGIEARGAFKQMLADASAANRTWRFILVYDVSRFSRGDLDEAGHLRYRFRQAGVEVIYCNENLTGGEADDLVVGVKQWMAQKYVKDLSRVTIRGQVSHSESGSRCGGTPPYGYDFLYHDSTGRPYQRVRWLDSGDKQIYDVAGKLIRVLPRGERLNTSKRDIARLIPSTPDRVETIQRIFRTYLDESRGFRFIADRLNRDSIPSPRNGNWSTNAKSMWSISTIREIIRNPAYRGDTAWNRRTFAKFNRVKGGTAEARSRVEANKCRENLEADWIVVQGTHEPLVPPATFDRAQELMKARSGGIPGRNFRSGSGLRSPYLLSGLMTCGRCGHHYQGRTVNSTKYRKDGTKIQNLYYACGAWVMKGATCCEKYLLRKEPLEQMLLETIRGRLGALLTGQGEALLRQYIEEEIAAQGQDPVDEVRQIEARIQEIDRKAGTMLEGLSPESRGFVDAKLRELAAEKGRLQSRLDAAHVAPRNAIDPDVVLRDGLAALRNLPRLFELGSLGERKELVQAFFAGVTVHPDENRVDLLVRRIPNLGVENSSVSVVAGARCEPVQMKLEPADMFVVGGTRAA